MVVLQQITIEEWCQGFALCFIPWSRLAPSVPLDQMHYLPHCMQLKFRGHGGGLR